MTIGGNFHPIISILFPEGEKENKTMTTQELQCNVTKLTQTSSYIEPVHQRTTQGSAFIHSCFLKGHN